MEGEQAAATGCWRWLRATGRDSCGKVPEGAVDIKVKSHLPRGWQWCQAVTVLPWAPFVWVLYAFWRNKSYFVLKNLFSASQLFSSASCLPPEKNPLGRKSVRLQQQLPARVIWFRDPYQRGPVSSCQTQTTPGRCLRDALKGLLENLNRSRYLLLQTGVSFSSCRHPEEQGRFTYH